MCCSLVWCSSTLVLTRMDNNLEKHSSKKTFAQKSSFHVSVPCCSLMGKKWGTSFSCLLAAMQCTKKEKLTTLWAFTYIPSPEFCSSSYPGWRRELVYGVSGSEKSYMLVPFLQQYKHNVRSCKSERGELSAGMQTDSI